ncbi:hypothetical protein NDU88_005252 [Pleurodeles waltl]|uniref:Uncharacterized protein n=1 Tax=Pleurodeles waltl TaxID=8319 RepID=A0AAV7QHS2_PLEWA|nr:hypothetical protein NDU88_005252 [Pleurodeles waltl]
MHGSIRIQPLSSSYSYASKMKERHPSPGCHHGPPQYATVSHTLGRHPTTSPGRAQPKHSIAAPDVQRPPRLLTLSATASMHCSLKPGSLEVI